MIHITLPEVRIRRLSFYLAMEEYVARHLNIDEAFFIWQVNPSVIFGRNQLIEAEVNVEYCRRHGVEMYRRKSGGGCVYADMSNMMLAYVTTSDSVSFTYHKYVNMVVQSLRRIGIPATSSGRNDILINGRKVSGNAFYHIVATTPGGRRIGKSIVHGTMLYDTDMRNMVSCITPDDEKLLSKGVQSVRQHITLLKEHTSLGLEDIKRSIIEFVCNGEHTLSPSDIRQIEEMEREYLSDEFIYGNNPRYSVVRKRRIEGVGTIEARMEIKHSVIKDIDFKGDYFLTGDVGAICQRLKDVPLQREALAAALPDPVSDIIMNLKTSDLIDLLIN